MSRIENSPRLIPSLYATIIRSFRWKTFERGDASKFPASSVFFHVMKKYRCNSPQAVAKHILGQNYFEEGKRLRRTHGYIMSATQFLKSLQFLRYNRLGRFDEEDIQNIIRELSEWLVSRTPEYEKAEWNF